MGLVSCCDGPIRICAPHVIPLSNGVRCHDTIAARSSIIATANTTTARTRAISRANTAFPDSSTDSSSETEAHSSSHAIRIYKNLQLGRNVST